MDSTAKKILGWIVVLVVVGVGLWLIGNQKSLDDKKAAEPIKIGVIAPLTGIAADYGEEIKRGIDSVNHDGIEVIYEDEKCEPRDTLDAFRKLTDIDKVNFIIGPACGSPQEAVAPLLKEKNVLAVVPSAASQNLYTQSGNNLFNIQYSLENESKFLADKITELDYKKVVLVTYQNAFSKTSGDAFKANYKGEVVKELSFPGDTTDVSSEIIKIKNLQYDAIVVDDISFFFAGGIEKLKQQGIKAPVFAQYVVELPAARPLVEGVIYSFPGNITEGEGAVFGLAKQSASLLFSLVRECKGDAACAKQRMMINPSIANGVMLRPIILKIIVNQEPLRYAWGR